MATMCPHQSVIKCCNFILATKLPPFCIELIEVFVHAHEHVLLQYYVYADDFDIWKLACDVIYILARSSINFVSLL